MSTRRQHQCHLSADIRSLVADYSSSLRAFGLSRFAAAGIALLPELRQLWRRPTHYVLCDTMPPWIPFSAGVGSVIAGRRTSDDPNSGFAFA
jgi:hypothetical protein